MKIDTAMRHWGWVGLTAVTLTTILSVTYGDFVGRFFAFDDFSVLDDVEHVAVQGLAGLPHVLVPWPSFAQYRPLTTIGWFWLARTCFGLDPRSWTVAQFATHLLNGLLVFAITRRLLRSSAAAFAAALIYTCAPGHALALRWIAFFTITGTTLAYFLALWTWLAAPERWRAISTTALVVVALLCSEHAISLPIALTAVALLGQGRRDGRRLARELAPVWAVGAVYVTAKLVFLYAPWGGGPSIAAVVFRNGYALDFDPWTATATLGHYVGAALTPLYRPDPPVTWCRPVGFLCLGVAAVALVVGASAGVRRPWLGVFGCGCALFLAGLGPVLFLPTHIYPAYVGIPALGAALAVIAPLTALPGNGAVALAAAAGFVAVHLHSTATAVRSESDFRFIELASDSAARWLATIDHLATPATREVVVPSDPITRRMFGSAHRQFLCAGYEVRPVLDVQGVAAAPPERLVIVKPSSPLPGPTERWHAIVRACPD